MTHFKTALIAIFGISFFVFITFFGRLPALRRTPIAGLYRLIWIRIPNALHAADQKLTSGKLTQSASGFANYMMHDRHPTVVVVFLLIMLVAEYLYIPPIWDRINLPTKASVCITVLLPHLFLYLSCAADPGYITPENHAYYMSLYPYDFALFHPGNHCSTCGFLKPARSKHCSVCKRCIAKADHHCVFINSCVGYGNHHWFLLLLASTMLLTSYGALLGLSLLSSDLSARYPTWALWPPRDLTWTAYLAVWGWGIRRDAAFGATTLLALLTTPLVAGLLGYTLYLVYGGTTTNESLKWSDWKEDMADGFVFRRPLPTSRREIPTSHSEPFCARWPVEPQEVLVITSDGQPPQSNKPLPGVGEWDRVWKLHQVENLYDMGFWDNLCDSFVPDYTFGAGSSSRNKTGGSFTTRSKQNSMYPP